MRKLFALMITVLLTCSFAVTAWAEGAIYANAGELYAAWNHDLPDYICGVWSTDGGTDNLTFGIQNTEEGNAGKQEMLRLLQENASVTFVYQKYSRNYLLDIQKEIDGYFQMNLGLISTGLDEINNCIVLGIHKSSKGNPDTQNMLSEITGKYGNAVSVEYTDSIIALTVDQESRISPWQVPMDRPFVFLPMGFVMLLLMGIILVIAIRRKMFLLQTNRGACVHPPQPPSSQEVVSMIKESDCDLPSDLKQKVMTAITDPNE